MPEANTSFFSDLDWKVFGRRSRGRHLQSRTPVVWQHDLNDCAMPFWLKYVAVSTHRQGWSYEHGASELSVIEIPMQGTLHVDYGGNEFTVEPGFACLLPAGEYNRLFMQEGPELKKLTFAFSGPCSALILTSLTRNAAIFKLENPTCVFDYYRRFKDLLAESNPEDLPRLTGLALQFVIDISSGVRREALPDVLVIACRIVSAGIGKRISGTEIAAMLHLSSYRLNRLFLRHFGYTVSRYMEYLRMEKARQLLLESGTCLVKDAASRTGYSSVFAFSAAFRNRYGVSPRDYRRRGVTPGPVYGKNTHRK
ncbi:MAG: HTH-type transcriptional activator Btr [Lentisphaerae bacterium ADurb.Bin242]|nr:MAG: HTH-type transcriptional activator Btr [Lentisphaerae bacterium ADurb.Bin242]